MEKYWIFDRRLIVGEDEGASAKFTRAFHGCERKVLKDFTGTGTNDLRVALGKASEVCLEKLEGPVMLPAKSPS